MHSKLKRAHEWTRCLSKQLLPVAADETPPCISNRAGLSLPPGWTWFWLLPTPLLLVVLKELPPDPSFGLHHHNNWTLANMSFQQNLTMKHHDRSLPRVRGGGPRSSTYSFSSCPCVCSGNMMHCLVLWLLCLLTCDTGRLQGMLRTGMLRVIWSCSATAAKVSLPRSALQPNP